MLIRLLLLVAFQQPQQPAIDPFRLLELEAQHERQQEEADKRAQASQAQRELELRAKVLQNAIDALEAYRRSDPANVNDIRKLRAARKACAIWLAVEKDPTVKEK